MRAGMPSVSALLRSMRISKARVDLAGAIVVTSKPTMEFTIGLGRKRMNNDIGATAKWQKPVLVRIGYGSSEPVQSASQALNYLLRRWPAERGPLYDVALQACKATPEGILPVQASREAFLAAAIEANVRA